MCKYQEYLTPELKKQVEERVEECINMANEYYGTAYSMPHIRYDLKGKSAGQAMLRQWMIKVHPVFLAENTEDYIENTISHEIAHLIDYDQHPENFTYLHGRKRRSVHGKTFKFIQSHVLKSDPSRCHTYSSKTVDKIKGKTTKTLYEYVCPVCEATVNFTKHRHTKSLKGRGYRLRTCTQKGCREYLKFTGKTIQEIQ